jgi:hypothetical protein
VLTSDGLWHGVLPPKVLVLNERRTTTRWVGARGRGGGGRGGGATGVRGGWTREALFERREDVGGVRGHGVTRWVRCGFDDGRRERGEREFVGVFGLLDDGRRWRGLSVRHDEDEGRWEERRGVERTERRRAVKEQ